jgi:hypothetical protein
MRRRVLLARCLQFHVLRSDDIDARRAAPSDDASLCSE